LKKWRYDDEKKYQVTHAYLRKLIGNETKLDYANITSPAGGSIMRNYYLKVMGRFQSDVKVIFIGMKYNPTGVLILAFS